MIITLFMQIITVINSNILICKNWKNTETWITLNKLFYKNKVNIWVNVKNKKHFSIFHLLHLTVSFHEKLYGLGNPCLSFMNHLANYQLTIRDQTTTKYPHIMTYFAYFNININAYFYRFVTVCNIKIVIQMLKI